MALSYANPTSGPSAGAIGWYDFANLRLEPNTGATNLGGTLNDGTTITFDIALAAISGQSRAFQGQPVPTFPGAEFGVAGYTGIAGNATFENDLVPLPGVSTITISNIVVKDAGGNLIPQYSVILADAERTNTPEQWIWNSNGGGWNLLAQLGGNPPSLTGLGTQTATITGTNLVASAAYVLYTQTPSQLVLTLNSPIASRQAFALGFAVTKVTIDKNIGDRIDPADQFTLNIGGTPAATATTTGASSGIQSETASLYAIPLNTYTINEVMAPGSGSTLNQYTQIVSAANATPAGSIPPVGNLPISFTPALGDDVTYTILNAAPETFTKSVDKTFANIGEVLTYSIVVDNPNNFAINNVLVTDATPAGTTYLGNLTVSAPFTGTDLPTGITITTIPADGSVTITWQVRVNSLPPTPNPIPNLGMVNVPGGTSGMTNVVTTQVNTAFVTLNKMVDKAFAKTGDTLTYTIMANNAGNVAANNVVIIDAVPAGTTFVPGSVTGATGTPPTFTLNGSIAPNSTLTMSFQVIVNGTIPPANPIPNAAAANYTYTVNPANPNGASGNAQSNTVNTQINQAIISMDKTVVPTFSDVDGVLTYTIVLNNTGNADANNVVITDNVPAGTTFVPGSVTGATGTPPTLALINPILAGGSQTVSFQVQVGDTIPTPNPVLNTASSAFTYTLDPEDPNGETGSATSNAASAQVNHADVQIVKSVDKAYADINDIIMYTLVLQNVGNAAAANVTINDVIPAGTTYIPGSLLGAVGTPPSLTLTSPLAPNGVANVSFQVKVNGALPQPNPLSNSASTAFNYTVDPANPNAASGSNNSNTVTTQINNATILTTKAVDKAFANTNDVLTYTITLQNTGNAAASNVTLNDVIPAGTTYVPNSLTGAAGTPPNITLLTPIGAGSSTIVTFQVKVNGTVPNVNPLDNQATANYEYTVDPADPNGASASSVSNLASTQVNNATLTIIKTADKNISYLGDVITYHLAVKNIGNVPANQVVITDIIANGLSYVSNSLLVSVPYSGTPLTGITLTGPIAPGQSVNISFQAKVNTMPLPNPIENTASASYVYTVDPADPNAVSATATSNPVPTIIFRNDYHQQINDLIESVALEEAALAAIANAEGAKIQKAVSLGNISEQELLCINKSVNDMLESLSILEQILKQKLGVVNCQIEGNAC